MNRSVFVFFITIFLFSCNEKEIHITMPEEHQWQRSVLISYTENTFPSSGSYYDYTSPGTLQNDSSIVDMLQLLGRRNIIVINAWFQRSSAGCGVSDVIVSARFTVRLAGDSPAIEKYGFLKSTSLSYCFANGVAVFTLIE